MFVLVVSTNTSVLPPCDELLRPYLDIPLLGKPKKVITKRVHSKAYHDEEARGLSFGFNIKKAQRLAGIFATKKIARWKKLISFPRDID